MKKDKPTKTQEFLIKKAMTEWLKSNKELMDDYTKLCSDLLFFNARWGIEIGFIFKKPEEIKGRGLGRGITEDLLETQKFINKIK